MHACNLSFSTQPRPPSLRTFSTMQLQEGREMSTQWPHASPSLVISRNPETGTKWRRSHGQPLTQPFSPSGMAIISDVSVLQEQGSLEERHSLSAQHKRKLTVTGCEWRDGTSLCKVHNIHIQTYMYLHWSNVILFTIQYFSSTYSMCIYTVASVLKSPHMLTVIFIVDLWFLLLIIR